MANLGIMISKSWVAELKKQRSMQRIRVHPAPSASPTHRIWGMDITYVHQCPVLGILDHGSRFAVSLTPLVNKSAWILLGHLFIAIGKYGKPKAIRTDNEPVFVSQRISFFLKLFKIIHQKTDKHSPWQNGRIERFFGSLKRALRIQPHLNGKLLFVWLHYYNTDRPHQHLNNKTPAEIFYSAKYNRYLSRANKRRRKR